MEGIESEIALETAHAQIVAYLAEKFPGVTVEAYREERKDQPLPGIEIELLDFETADDKGTGQYHARCRFAARVIVKAIGAGTRLEVRKLAAKLAVALHRQRPCKPASAAVVVSGSPDDFEPRYEGCRVWRVDFAIDLDFGPPYWRDLPSTAGTPVFSWDPQIGVAHEDKYKLIEELEPPP